MVLMIDGFHDLGRVIIILMLLMIIEYYQLNALRIMILSGDHNLDCPLLLDLYHYLWMYINNHDFVHETNLDNVHDHDLGCPHVLYNHDIDLVLDIETLGSVY